MFCRDLEFSPNIMDFSFRQIQKSNLSQILAQIKKRLMTLIRLLRNRAGSQNRNSEKLMIVCAVFRAKISGESKKQRENTTLSMY